MADFIKIAECSSSTVASPNTHAAADFCSVNGNCNWESLLFPLNEIDECFSLGIDYMKASAETYPVVLSGHHINLAQDHSTGLGACVWDCVRVCLFFTINLSSIFH